MLAADAPDRRRRDCARATARAAAGARSRARSRRSRTRPPWRSRSRRPSGPSTSIGITGRPGAGKSTLTGRLIEAYANAGARVGVIAIDPSSPISGGAVLGDRVRMETHDLLGRDDVFVRSLASRGSHGAVAAATRNVARLLEATGSLRRRS